MNEVEFQAHEYVRRKEWNQALYLFDELLGHAVSKGLSKEKVVSFLLGRSECCLELGRHEAVVLDCRRVIKLLQGTENNNSNLGARARRRLVHALFSLRRFGEAEAAALEWIASSDNTSQTNTEALKMLERVRLVLQMANGQKNSQNRNYSNPHQRVEDDILALDYKLESWIGTGVVERSARSSKHPVELIDEPTKSESRPTQEQHIPDFHYANNSLELINAPLTDNNQQSFIPMNQVVNMPLMNGFVEPEKKLSLPNDKTVYSCTYCCLNFNDRSELQVHCGSESHQTVIMSDEGRDWKWRPPPRGFTGDNYSLCEAFMDGGENACRYGAQCVEAHGVEELTEWKQRFEYRRMRLQRAAEKELYGKSYTEQLLEKWLSTTSPEKVLREHIKDVEDSCEGELETTVASKSSSYEWNFLLKSKRPLRAVALLQDAHRNHFSLRRISTSDPSQKTKFDCEPNNNQEWLSPIPMSSDESFPDDEPKLEYLIKVSFVTDIYGTFRQSVVFDFGTDPVLVKHVCVDVVPISDVDKLKEIKKVCSFSHH